MRNKTIQTARQRKATRRSRSDGRTERMGDGFHGRSVVRRPSDQGSDHRRRLQPGLSGDRCRLHL